MSDYAPNPKAQDIYKGLAQQKLSNAIQGFSTGSGGVVGTTVRTSIDTALETVVASKKVNGVIST